MSGVGRPYSAGSSLVCSGEPMTLLWPLQWIVIGVFVSIGWRMGRAMLLTAWYAYSALLRRVFNWRCSRGKHWTVRGWVVDSIDERTGEIDGVRESRSCSHCGEDFAARRIPVREVPGSVLKQMRDFTRSFADPTAGDSETPSPWKEPWQ
jgi:hypothetical protein